MPGAEEPFGPTSRDSKSPGNVTLKLSIVSVTVLTVPNRFVTKTFDGLGPAGPVSFVKMVPAGMVMPAVLQ